MLAPRRLACALLAVMAAALGGCGGDDVRNEVERARDRVAERFEELKAKAQDEFEERRERYGERIDEVLAEVEQVVPEAETTDPAMRSQGNTEPGTIDDFMTGVLTNIDEYWTKTFAAADLPAPSVNFVSVVPGSRQPTACGEAADDSAAFYCPVDDTIYVAQQFAAALYEGVVSGLPGERAGFGRAAGDFAVAYVLAHEYAHNLQQELGVFDNAIGGSAKPFELNADCLSGTWAHSVFEQGLLEDGDIEEATNAALAVGDFDVANEQHHGTPVERRDALLTGYESGDPGQCNRYLEQA